MIEYYKVNDNMIVKKDGNFFYCLDNLGSWIKNGRIMDMFYDAAYDWEKISEAEVKIEMQKPKYYNYNGEMIKLDGGLFYVFRNNDWMFAQHLADTFSKESQKFTLVATKEEKNDIHR